MVATQRKSAPRPGNGGARQGSGPLRQVMTWKPFSAGKGESFSYTESLISLRRCNHCGAFEIAGYFESVLVMNGSQNVKNLQRIWHDGQPMQHRDDCPLKEG